MRDEGFAAWLANADAADRPYHPDDLARVLHAALDDEDDVDPLPLNQSGETI